MRCVHRARDTISMHHPGLGLTDSRRNHISFAPTTEITQLSARPLWAELHDKISPAWQESCASARMKPHEHNVSAHGPRADRDLCPLRDRADLIQGGGAWLASVHTRHAPRSHCGPCPQRMVAVRSSAQCARRRASESRGSGALVKRASVLQPCACIEQRCAPASTSRPRRRVWEWEKWKRKSKRD